MTDWLPALGAFLSNPEVWIPTGVIAVLVGYDELARRRGWRGYDRSLTASNEDDDNPATLLAQAEKDLFRVKFGLKVCLAAIERRIARQREHKLQTPLVAPGFSTIFGGRASRIADAKKELWARGIDLLDDDKDVVELVRLILDGKFERARGRFPKPNPFKELLDG